MDITSHKRGEVSYHDPYIPQVKTNEGREFSTTDLSAKTLAKVDCVVLTTNHKDFDIEFIKENAKLIVDLRNMVEFKGEKVIKL
jgi:UDP-N-acetyl-D-glucosamine dehydrogenase